MSSRHACHYYAYVCLKCRPLTTLPGAPDDTATLFTYLQERSLRTQERSLHSFGTPLIGVNVRLMVTIFDTPG